MDPSRLLTEGLVIVRHGLAFALAAVIAAPVPASAFTAADVLSAPFPDALVASADGTVLVWKVDASGIRNLYADAGGNVHALTHYDRDDGQDVFSPQVTADDSAVVYFRANAGDEGTGDNANPLSLIPPPQRTLYVVPVSGGDPVKLADGSNGAYLSPKGDLVAFTTSQGQLGVVSLVKDGGGYIGGTPGIVPIRGSVSDPAWSPDGSKLAFTLTRGDHSYIVVYTPAKKSYRYVSPDFTLDDDAAWSPDGSRLAFVRMPGKKIGETIYDLPTLESTTSSSLPWSLWVADANGRNARKIWTAKHGVGHEFYPTASASQLWWMKGDVIAFPWEGDGWCHMYAVSANGGAAKNVTPGPYEVETVAESLDRRELLLQTNEGNLDERHLWSVALSGKPKQLTHGPDNQWYPTALANGGLAYIDAGYAAPPQVTVAGDPVTTLVAVKAPASYPQAQMVEPRIVTFAAPDGTIVHGQYFLPRHAGGKVAAMVFVHGGPPRQMLAGFHYMEPYTHLYEMNQYLVNRGFAVLSINYRLGTMYGYAFRTPRRSGWLGGAEYQDVLAGAKWLQKQPAVDAHRIGIYGLSYGGLLTALALARNSDIFKAGADFAGVHDWPTIFDHDYGGRFGTARQRHVARMSTAEGYLDRWRSPVFIEQGDDDRNVAFSQGVDLVTKLRERGVTVETQVFPNETHENSVWAHLVEQYTAAADFLVRYLQR